MREPALPSPKPLSPVPVKKAAEKPATSPARASSPPASVRSGSTASRASKRTTNIVRILGKDGEESFVELPVLSSRPLSPARSEVTKPHRSSDDQEKVEKAKRDATAAEAAMKLRHERESDARAAANAMMSGALPASSKSSKASSAKKSSSNVSAGAFDKVSKAPSVASSTTTVTKPSSAQNAASSREPKKSSREPSKTHSQQGHKKPTKEDSNVPPNAGMHEVGWATYEPAVNKPAPRESNAPPVSSPMRQEWKSETPEHSVHGTPGFQEVNPRGGRPASVHTVSDRRSGYQHDSPQQSMPGKQDLEHFKSPNKNSQDGSAYKTDAKGSASQHKTPKHSFKDGPGFKRVEPDASLNNPHFNPDLVYSMLGIQPPNPVDDNPQQGSINNNSGRHTASQHDTPQHHFRSSAAYGPTAPNSVNNPAFAYNGPGFHQFHSPNNNVQQGINHTVSNRRSKFEHDTAQHSLNDGAGFQHYGPSGFNNPAFQQYSPSGVKSPVFQQHSPSGVNNPAFQQYGPSGVNNPAFQQYGPSGMNNPEFQQYSLSHVNDPAFQQHNAHGINNPAFADNSNYNHPFAPLRQDSPPPTVFAGRGWISPHPLSEASSHREEPQRSIVLPGMQERGPTTLTYQDWKTMQQASGSPARPAVHQMQQAGVLHRNFSRTESEERRTYEAGSWGRRKDYRSPLAGSGEGRLPIVKEEVEDGKVQLKMPWDQPQQQEERKEEEKNEENSDAVWF